MSQMTDYRVTDYRGLTVDGYHEESNTIYEFHGCLWHGCLKCYKADTFNNFLQSTIAGINGRHLYQQVTLNHHFHQEMLILVVALRL